MATTTDEVKPTILDVIEEKIRTYAILPSDHAYVGVTLWVAATWCQDQSDFATRLCFTAPEMRCGKSRALKMAEVFACNPISSVNSSTAVLVADIEENKDDGCTLILDEYDQWLSSSGPIVGVLNGGFERGKPYRRMENGQRIEKSTYAMAALAGIGALPPTAADRSLVIHMRRRGPDETVQPFRKRRDELPLRELGGELGAWVREHRLEIAATDEPAMPVEDRAADLWSILMRIAAVATREQGLNEAHPRSWLYRARQAALALTSEAEANMEGSRGQRLLAVIKEVFDALALKAPKAKTHRIANDDLVEHVHKADPDSWGELDVLQLAGLLRPYGIRAKVMRLPRREGTVRGYTQDMFVDAWLRYLPREESAAEGAEDGEVVSMAS